MKPAFLTAQAETQIQFHHLDPMNIVWHGNYADFFELARVELMEKIDYGYGEMEASGYAWPVIELKVRYARPLLFRMKVIIIAELVEWENRVKVRFRIVEKESGTKLCSGHTIQVAVDKTTHEMLWVTPEVFKKKLEPHLP
ncbi:acyl-CoA thioesterase [Henriciella litoralis]|uniref:acyl-CoA thioesterase n=1 Tax=Henriciella litoralis TaxID=568102 RepID=UPI000A075296|nr:acyl-CoA thioesterase [Henriciella litoralis]